MRTGRPRTQQEVQCHHCGLAFTKSPSEIARNKTGRFFCSPGCRNAVGSKPRLKTMCTCQQCGTEFYPRAAGANAYCSKVCHDIGQRTSTREQRSCESCGIEFEFNTAMSKWNAGRFCGQACYQASRATPVGTRKPTSDGYVLIYQTDEPGAHASGYILEHRYVMQQQIGRSLLSGEEVHHRNAKRDDNRLKNLELWNTSHPAGARVEDVIAHAEEMLALYKPSALAKPNAAVSDPPVRPGRGSQRV